ncbi:MAG: hypothetical protein E7F56_07765, partial [Limosilactobacillus fermentum]|nr:hypothetical protein [Limosilactobacillus fermentum]
NDVFYFANDWLTSFYNSPHFLFLKVTTFKAIVRTLKRQNEFLTTGATLKLARLTADNTKTL